MNKLFLHQSKDQPSHQRSKYYNFEISENHIGNIEITNYFLIDIHTWSFNDHEYDRNNRKHEIIVEVQFAYETNSQINYTTTIDQQKGNNMANNQQLIFENMTVYNT